VHLRFFNVISFITYQKKTFVHEVGRKPQLLKGSTYYSQILSLVAICSTFLEQCLDVYNMLCNDNVLTMSIM
jgi:hypothetical protein